MKKSIKNVFVLVSICAVVSVLLAITNAVTAPIIAENERASANAALLEVMPDGGSFTSVALDGYTLPATVTEAYLGENGGYVFKLKTVGYSSGFVIMCGVNADGTVSGAVCLASTETLGHEKTFGALLTGKTAENIDAVDTVSGATKTTGAYRAAVKDALNAALILGGGSVDIRTEEEILRDRLTAALPAAQGEFEKLFITESLDGVDAVYAAVNRTGYVLVIGDAFVATDLDGHVITKETAQDETAETAMAALLASELSPITLDAYEGLPSQLVSASRTATGNYDLVIKGAGYGIAGGSAYHPASGEYIYIRVSLTRDGRILDCLTLSQAETDGIGSACADESFYGQFVGKTEETYGEIDAIGGATYTTDGYKQAILRAFACVKIFEGGVES
ncbi:MAG: FMN-binding protein [Clostridia bacterium]|nr:FMN-binding protein [Clostridia bacterium]